MKKKFLVLSLGLILTLGLSGCGKDNSNGGASDKASNQEESIYSNLSAWLGSGQGVECTVNSPEGNIVVKSKGGKVRMDGIMYFDMNSTSPEPQTGSSITDGDWVYMWSGTSGMKMNVKDMEEMGEDMMEESNFEEDDYDWETWSDEMDDAGIAYQCEEKNISDDEFVVPADVDFKDLNAMMEGLQTIGQDVLDNLGDTQGMNQEDIEAQLEELMGR